MVSLAVNLTYNLVKDVT